MVRLMMSRLFHRLVTRVDHRAGWHRLPTPLGLVALVGIRNRLRARNLHDTGSPATPAPDPDPTQQSARTADGTYNDLANPAMGSAGSRFGRNVPLDRTHPDRDRMLQPNPRTVSLELLTREKFIPAPTLNVLAAAWLQFMIRDWFSHGKSPHENPWEVPLAGDDPWPDHPMRIMRTRPDPTRTPAEDAAGLPPTYVNVETHWWDGSQLYGSDAETQAKVRLGEDGKLRVGEDGLVPVDPKSDKHPADEPGFWVGLAMLHSLFIREHNAICDRLKAEYPAWSDDELFHRARLINAALLAKIHTVEWTTAILGHPALQVGMRANWWGVLHTPGHSPGHLAFWWPERRALFTGDAVATWPMFAGGWPAFNINETHQRASLRRMAELDPEVLGVGHGDPILDDAAARLRSLVTTGR